MARRKGSAGRKVAPAVADQAEGNIRAELHDKVRSFTVEGGKSQTMRVRVNVRESWLEYALHRSWIDQRQYQAGMELRSDHERSSLHTERAADYTREMVDGGGSSDGAIVARLDAAHRVVTAIIAVDAVEYPLGQVCRRVAIQGQGPREIEGVYHWRHGQGAVTIKAALDALAQWQDRNPR